MQFNPKAIALLLSACVAAITTGFVLLVPDVPKNAILIASLLSFFSSYILVRIFLEFFFYRQIDEIHNNLKQIKDGKFYLKKSAANPLKRINNEISDYVKSKQEEIDRLTELENFRREFIADVSHELKTPIFAAQGFVHTLIDGAIYDKEVRKKFLKKAAKSLDGLDLLVQDLLTISQIESGDIKMHYENFDMVALCREVLDQLETRAEKNEIDLNMPKKYSDPIIVRGDYRRIYQVMMNLVSNAIKYTRKNGKARIKFKEVNGKIRTIVQDSGRGIPKEHISRIFERFYRVEKSRSREKGGTGLGLSIVKHILEGHDSEIFVESKFKVGSKFYFELKKAKYIEHVSVESDDDEEFA
jgi:two-component system phosphate regulon sensor histidine kinase PhoR